MYCFAMISQLIVGFHIVSIFSRIFEHNLSSRQRISIAFAKNSGSDGGTIKPVTPSVTALGSAPTLQLYQQISFLYFIS